MTNPVDVMPHYAITTLKRGSKGEYVSNRAFCPEHKQSSTVMLGGQRDFDGTLWVTFRCKLRGGHAFNVLPAKGVPGPAATWEEWEKWKNKQRLAASKAYLQKGKG